MAYTQVAVTGTVLLSNGVAAQNASVSFTLNTAITDGSSIVNPEQLTAVANSSGLFSITLNANDDVTTLPLGTYYKVMISWQEQTVSSFNVIVPHASAPTVNLFTLATLPNPNVVNPYVSQLVAGTNVTLTPAGGTGAVTVNASGGGSGGASVTTRNVSGTVALSVTSSGSSFIDTLTGNTTYSSPTGPVAGTECAIDILLTQDATGGRTVTWFSGITWVPGAAPTIPVGPGLQMLISFVSLDGGTTWFGAYNSTQGGQPAAVHPSFQAPIMGGGVGATHTANSLYVVGLPITGAATITGVAIDDSTTAGDTLLVSLFNAAGTKVAASAATAQAGTSQGQSIPFTSPYVAAAGFYYLGFQFQLGTGKTTDSPFGTPTSVIAQGSFVVPTSIVVPTVISRQGIPLHTTF